MPRREKITARQVNALLMAEGISKFCILLPILVTGNWRGRALGIFTAACLAGCFVAAFAERWMWAEDTCYHTLLYTHGRKIALAVYAALFWFFIAQIIVMLRLAAEVLLYYFGMTAREGMLVYSFIFLPFLISSGLNALFYVRRLFLRLYQEGTECSPLLQRDWIFRIRDWIWWAMVVLLCAMAAGFRDRYSLAGFYCAYNWEIMAALFVLFWIFSAFRKKNAKRDCRD